MTPRTSERLQICELRQIPDFGRDGRNLIEIQKTAKTVANPVADKTGASDDTADMRTPTEIRAASDSRCREEET